MQDESTGTEIKEERREMEMANTEKINEEMLSLSTVVIDELEKQLGIVYDSFVNIDTMVRCSTSNIENMSKAFVKMSNINMVDSCLDLSLQSMTQNVDALVKSVGCLKSDFEEICELYINTFNSTSSVPNSSTEEGFQTEDELDWSGFTKVIDFLNEGLANVLIEEMITKIMKNIPSSIKLGSIVGKEGKKKLLRFLAGIEEVIKGITPIIDVISYVGEQLLAVIRGLSKWKVLLAGVASILAGYYGLRRGDELEDLRLNIEVLGEEEGRAAAGTGFWDRQALYQYDSELSNRILMETWGYGNNSTLEDSTLQEVRSGTGPGKGPLLMISPPQKLISDFTQAFVEMGIELVKAWEESGFNEWWIENIESLFSLENWQELGNNIQKALSTKWEEFVEWWTETSFYQWWTENVFPFFSLETWQELGNGIQIGLATKWNEFVEWWKSTGVYKWWEEEIKPFFTEEKWTFSAIGEGLSKSWKAAVDSIKGIWNQFAMWLNEKLTIEIDTSTIIGAGIYDLLGTDIITIGSLPTFAVGGFPEDGLFMANHGELVGQFSNGRTVVANNEQIITGIKLGVKDAVSEVLVPYLSDISKNTKETANKDFSTYIGDKEIARANERGRRAMGMQLITEF